MKETTKSETDPLSPATRLTKRNLLAASILAITYKAFHVRVSDLLIGDAKIEHNEGAFDFLFTISTAYFLVAFATYFWIDYKNLVPLWHQEKIIKDKESELQKLRTKYWKKIGNHLRELLSPEMRNDINITVQVDVNFDDCISWLSLPTPPQNDPQSGPPRDHFKIYKSGLYGQSHEINASDKQQQFFLAMQHFLKWRLYLYNFSKCLIRVQSWMLARMYTFRIIFLDFLLPTLLGGLAVTAMLHFTLSERLLGWLAEFFNQQEHLNI